MNSQPTNHSADETLPRPAAPVSFGIKILLFAILTVLWLLAVSIPDVLLSAALLSMVSGLFAFCFLLTFSPLYILSAVPAFLIPLLLTKSPISAAPALIGLLCGAVLTAAFLKRTRKTWMIISVSAAACIGFLLCLFYLHVSNGGSLTPKSIADAYAAYFENVKDELRSFINMYLEVMYSVTQENPPEIPESIIVTATDLMKLLTPAVIGVFAEVFGFLTVLFYTVSARIFQHREMIPQNFRITVSPFTSIVFIISVIISSISSASGGKSALGVYSVCITLVFLLSPALFILGIRSLIRKAKTPFLRRSFITSIIFLGVLFFLNPVFALFFVIVDGVIETFTQNIRIVITRK